MPLSEARKAKMRAYYFSNREKFLAKKREYYSQNFEKISERKKRYYLLNSEHIISKNLAYINKRSRVDTIYKLSRNLRSRLNLAVRNNYIGGKAVRELGCSIEEFKLYLESLFQQDMTWENYGRKGWHIDHIIPLANYDLSNPEQLKQACHYTNLQPLWWYDNLKKASNGI